MKVILKDDLVNLGQAGEVVEVKPGYGRNYLIPRGLAVVANKSNVRRYEEETRQRAHKLEQKRKDAEALANRLDGMEIELRMPVGEENRLFGTVTTQQIAEVLAEKNIELDRRKIVIGEEIRVTGIYTATVKVHPEHDAELKLRVVNEEGVMPAPPPEPVYAEPEPVVADEADAEEAEAEAELSEEMDSEDAEL